MAEEYNQREHMEQVLRDGGSVYHRGAIIHSMGQLPSAASLAKGNTEQEAAARAALERQRAAIDADLQLLGSPASATAKTGMDDLPDDFPGRAALADAGYTKLSQVNELSEEELTAIAGIGPATAAKIIEARK